MHQCTLANTLLHYYNKKRNSLNSKLDQHRFKKECKWVTLEKQLKKKKTCKLENIKSNKI